MTSSESVFVSGLDVFASVVDRVDTAGWDHPSACAGWTNRDVLGHLGTSLDLGIQFLQGGHPAFPEAERPGDLVEGEPSAWIADLAARSRTALAAADLDLEVDTPMGRRTVRDRLAFPAIDLWVHAWDIGHGLGIDVEVPAEVAEFAHGYIDPFPVEMVRGANGAFGPEVEAPADATPTEAFIAWTGRTPR